ncbi:MAG: glutathione S-transferase family protein [Pseudohongiellaceae bacterium]
MLTLFYAPNSCALASHLALELSGLPYEARKVDFANNEQRSPAFLKINPKGRVPALATGQGIITENPAILTYIAQCAPQAQLAPLDDPFAFAQLQSFNSYLASTVHVAHAHRYRGYRWADAPEAIAAMKQKVPQNMRECFGLIERELLQGPWVLGERLSVCDLYLFTIGRWLPGDDVDIREFPRVAEHAERLLQMAVVQRVLESQ